MFNVDNSDYISTSTFNNVVRSQVGNFFFMHENIRSFWKNVDEFHSFGFELNRAADGIVFSETWFSANTCHGVQGYTGFHTYRADKTGGSVSVFIRNCYTSIHIAKFSVCHAYYEIKCGEGFALKQLYRNYYWCLKTTRQIKDYRVYNKIE